MTAADKLNNILEHLGINAKVLSERLGYDRPQIMYDIQNGKTKRISDSLANKIVSVFSEIDKVWLLTGEGSMLKSSGEHSTSPPVAEQGESGSYTLLLPTAAQGGSLNDFVASVKAEDCEKIVSPIRDVDFAIQISGDSMAPEYPNGSRVFVKRINDKAFIEWGRAYVLDTCNGAVVKILAPSEKEGYVRCLSINPDPMFAPFEINTKDIRGIYRILLGMSLK